MTNNINILRQCTKVLKLLLSGKPFESVITMSQEFLDIEETEFVEIFNIFLEKYKEGMNFVKEVSKGNLDIVIPPNNLLICQYKQLHADLKYLLWQMNQLTQGDYSQHVEFMGDFSNSFNMLIAALIERKKLLEQIRKSDTFHKSLLKIAPDDISISDINGNLTFISEKGIQMFGYDCEVEILGRNVIEFVAPEYHEKVINIMGEILKGNYSGVYEYLAVKKDGSYFWAESNAEVLRNDNGEPEAMLFVLRDTTIKKEMEKKLIDFAKQMEINAKTDLMTGMFNSFEGLRVLSMELNRAMRNQNQLAIVFIDMDGLKHVNDHFGHEEGDRLILILTRCIQQNVRVSDYIVRMGGDEFIIILPETELPVAEKIILRIEKSIEKSNLEFKIKAPLTFSYGISLSTPENRPSAKELINEADKKMYQQKKRKL